MKKAKLLIFILFASSALQACSSTPVCLDPNDEATCPIHANHFDRMDRMGGRDK